MLDSHPDLAIPPETGFLAADPADYDGSKEDFAKFVANFPPGMPMWGDFGIDHGAWVNAVKAIEPFCPRAGFREFYRLYAARFGKSRWGDKTPRYALHLGRIAELLPESRFIHLIRDGRDVALSWREMWFSPGREISTLAASWRDWVAAGREAGASLPHYLEIFFEELVRNPEAVLRRICGFIGIEFDSAMLAYYQRSAQRLAEHKEGRRVDGTLVVSRERRLWQQRSTTLPLNAHKIGTWRTGMSALEKREFEKVAGRLLQALGYSISSVGSDT
jgi:Sulfotransferase family